MNIAIANLYPDAERLMSEKVFDAVVYQWSGGACDIFVTKAELASAISDKYNWEQRVCMGSQKEFPNLWNSSCFLVTLRADDVIEKLKKK